MRSYIFPLSLLALASLGAGIFGYFEYQAYLEQESTTIVVALDITDSDLSLPSSDYVIEQSGLTTNLYGEISIEFVLVTDEELAPVYQLHLEKEFKWFADERLRRKKVHEFSEEVAQILFDIELMNRELKHSAIYTHVNAALQRLKNTPGKKKLILASNGYESTEKFSVYHKSSLVKKRFIPEAYAKNLKQIETPADISDIEIVFYMNPNGRMHSVYQKQVVEAYALLYPEAIISIETL